MGRRGRLPASSTTRAPRPCAQHTARGLAQHQPKRARGRGGTSLTAAPAASHGARGHPGFLSSRCPAPLRLPQPRALALGYRQPGSLEGWFRFEEGLTNEV